MFIDAATEFDKRPEGGYTYIYIYSLDNLYLYVGQTIQSLEARYTNHLADNSGAHYANCIAYFQIRSSYANYAEGYIANRVNGICQGNIPNPEKHKDQVPKEIRKILQKIGNKLCNRRLCDKTLLTGELPLFSIEINNDGSKMEPLKLLSLLLQEKKIIDRHYPQYPVTRNHSPYSTNLYISEITHIVHNTKGYLLSRPKGDFRPVLFLMANSVEQVLFCKKIIANFPVYCIVPEDLYNRYEKNICQLFRKNQTGLIVKRYNKLELIMNFHPHYRELFKIVTKSEKDAYIGINKEFVSHCHETSIKAKFTPYNYYQCA